MHGTGRVICEMTPVSAGIFVEQGALKAAAWAACKTPIYSPFVPFPLTYRLQEEVFVTILGEGVPDAFACVTIVCTDESLHLFLDTYLVACSCL